jgi:hypothetical protein
MRIRRRIPGALDADLTAPDDVSTIQGIGYTWIRNIKVNNKKISKIFKLF